MKLLIDIPDKIYYRLRSCLGHGYCIPNQDVKCITKVIYNGQHFTEEEIQKMQDLEQAEIQKAFELGKAEAHSEIISGMCYIQEALDVLEIYRRNMIHILGDSDEKVKVIETCQMLISELEENKDK